MRVLPLARHACGLAAALLVVGCAAGGSQVSSPPRTAPQATFRSTAAIAPAARITTCPDDRVYVADADLGEVRIYPKDWAGSPAPCATLVADTIGAAGLSVDKNETLYVANSCCNAIDEFPKNASQASLRILTAETPSYAAAGPDGTLYVCESSQIEEFARGKTTATRTIPLTFGCPGLAIDAKNNLYALSFTSAGGSRVLEFANHSTTGTDLGISVGAAFSMALTKNGSIVIGDTQASTVDVFAPGATVPTRSFPTAFPYNIVLSQYESKLYVVTSNEFGQIPQGTANEYDFVTGASLSEILPLSTMSNPDGVAYSPAAAAAQ